VDPVPDPLLSRKSGSAWNRTRDLGICSQKLWPLDHRGGHFRRQYFLIFPSIPTSLNIFLSWYTLLTLITDAEVSSEKLIHVYYITLHHIPKYHNVYNKRHANLKSLSYSLFSSTFEEDRNVEVCVITRQVQRQTCTATLSMQWHCIRQSYM
jgi:hypothetical protein